MRHEPLSKWNRRRIRVPLLLLMPLLLTLESDLMWCSPIGLLIRKAAIPYSMRKARLTKILKLMSVRISGRQHPINKVNFLQHVKTLLKINGKAAIVVSIKTIIYMATDRIID